MTEWLRKKKRCEGGTACKNVGVLNLNLLSKTYLFGMLTSIILCNFDPSLTSLLLSAAFLTVDATSFAIFP